MIRIGAALLLATVCLPAAARDDAAIAISDLVSKPIDALKAKVGEIVVVRGIPCVDPGTNGFLCVGTSGSRSVRIDGILLGAATALPIAERLLERCKGLAALSHPECRVDALVTPTSFERSADGASTLVHSNEIDLYAPRKR